MKTIKISEATNTQLDWLVAKCEGAQGILFDGRWWRVHFGVAEEYLGNLDYTASWSLMGSIIERECIDVLCLAGGDDGWQCDKYLHTEKVEAFGPTPLIAAARCYVASKLGEIVEVPEELK